jgi:hypothetical protein
MTNIATGKSGDDLNLKTQLVIVKLQSIGFKNDHALLKNNTSDWRNTGSRYDKPEWGQNSNYPVSLSMDSVVSLKATFDITLKKKDQISCEIDGNADDDFLCFSLLTTLKSGKASLVLTSSEKIPKYVRKLIRSINWSVRIDNRIIIGNSGPHTIYVTFGPAKDSGLPEDGVTEKRMRTAVDWVSATSCVQPVRIVEALFKNFHGYTLGYERLHPTLKDELDQNPLKKQALLDAGFPTYLKSSIGGAWLLTEFKRYGGECQAIVRLIRGILHQIGCKDTIEVKYINADAPDYLVTKIESRGSECSGPDSDKDYSLVDGEVKVGNIYGDNDGIGFNNFEAYLKFTYTNSAGQKRIAWFGGGIGLLYDLDALNQREIHEYERKLILVFWGLVESESIFVNGEWKYKITKIWKYPK